jgi:hypothetical protein
VVSQKEKEESDTPNQRTQREEKGRGKTKKSSLRKLGLLEKRICMAEWQ